MKARARLAFGAAWLVLCVVTGASAIACAVTRAPGAHAGSPAQQREEPETCRENRECGEEAYCAKPKGRCGDAGTCRARPDACAQIWDPVCGCDGKTYSSACHAALAGVNVQHDGECDEERER